MDPDYRGELIGWFDTIASRPSMFATTPEAAEGQLLTLLQAIYCLDHRCSMVEAVERVRAEVRDLVRDVPASPSQYVFLHEETAIPERRGSFALLIERAEELKRRLIGPS